MPRLTLACPKGQRRRDAGVRGPKWMDDGEEELSVNSCPKQTAAGVRPWTRWRSAAPVCVLWSVCQTEAPLDPSSFALDVCGRLLLVCLLWTVVGGFGRALKLGLKPGQNRGERPQSTKQDGADHVSPSRGPAQRPPLALTVADCLLVCVLQEPLSDPTVPHVRALLCRLESVSHTLESAAAGSEATPNGPDRDSTLADKVKVLYVYLQQRTGLLRALVQVQRDFEAGVKDMLGGLGGLWTQLEDLHTGVTLSKEASRGCRDLALAQTDAKTLFSVLGHYRNKLQSCQDNLKDCTELLQELIWSHTHIGNSVSGIGGGESVWPELLLQSNIEQFDKAQESFLSLEQQTRAFQAHLEGLQHREAHSSSGRSDVT